MSSKKFDWITAKEVVGGFIRFIVMAGIGYLLICNAVKLYNLIDAGKITDWRVILTMEASNKITIIVLIIAYMRLGIKTTDAHATKFSMQAKIAGQEIAGEYEKKAKD